MKKKIIKLLVCTGLICMALTGCEDKKSEVKNEEKVENNQDVGADVQDILDEATALEDGEYSVGFKPEDVIEKNGTYHLKIDLYSCNHYSKEEIENLKEGSIISICDKDVEVKKVEKNEKGIYEINGGPQGGDPNGYDFSLDSETGLYVAGFGTPYTVFYTTGKVTLPITSGKVTYIDESGSNEGTESIVKKEESEGKELGAFLKQECSKGGFTSFVPENTIITVEDGCVVQIKKL